MTDATPNPDLAAVAADEFAQMIAGATDDQIAAGINGPQRKQVLDEIFRRMADHVDGAKAKGTDAVIHWKILDHPEGGYDHYEVIVTEGVVKVSDEPAADPRVTLQLGPVDFIKLVSGREAGPIMFISGRLRIEGDLMFAAQLTSVFRIPKAG